MKNYTKSILLPLLGILSLASCSDKSQAEAGFEMKVVAENPTTLLVRTELGDNGLTPLWTAHEQIGITFGQGSFPLTGENTTSAASTTFSGKVSVPTEATQFYAFHPHTAQTNGTEVWFTIPTTQQGGNNFPHDILISQATSISTDGNPIALSFTRHSALINIVMKINGVTKIDPQTARIAFIAFSHNSEGNFLTGKAPANLTNGVLGAVAKEGQYNILSDYTQSFPVLQDQLSSYMTCFPVTIAAGAELVFGWTLADYTTIQKTVTLTKPIEIRAGHIVTFNVTITDQEIGK